MTVSCVAITAARLAPIASSQSAMKLSGPSATPSRDNNSYTTIFRMPCTSDWVSMLLVELIKPPKLIAATCRTSGTRSVLRDGGSLPAWSCGSRGRAGASAPSSTTPRSSHGYRPARAARTSQWLESSSASPAVSRWRLLGARPSGPLAGALDQPTADQSHLNRYFPGSRNSPAGAPPVLLDSLHPCGQARPIGGSSARTDRRTDQPGNRHGAKRSRQCASEP